MSDLVLYEVRDRKAYLTLNRPDRLNAITADVARALKARVDQADADPDVHVIVLQGAGRAFSAGYDMKEYAEEGVDTQDEVWDPIRDFAMNEVQHRRLLQPLALAETHARQGPRLRRGRGQRHRAVLRSGRHGRRRPDRLHALRVWGCRTTAMWVYRLGAERAKRMLLTGDTIDGRTAADWGLVVESVPADDLDERWRPSPTEWRRCRSTSSSCRS